MTPDGRQGPGRRLFTRACIVLVAASLVAFLLLSQRQDLRVNLAYATEASGPGEIFFAGPEEGFGAGRSASFPITSDGAPHKYRVDLQWRQPVAKLRLDLATAPGSVELQSLELRGRVLGLKTARRQVVPVPVASQEVTGVTVQDGALRFVSTGNDPAVELELPAATMAALGRETTWLTLLASLLLGLAAALLDALLRGTSSWGRYRRAAIARLDALAPLVRACSDRGAITFTPATVAVLLLALVMAAAGVAGRLNFSSVAMWNAYLPSAGAEDPTLIGTPRAIRADEWLVASPWMLSQAANGYPLENLAVGSQHSTLLTSMPVRHAVAVLQPEFWGFALFDVERAVSWHWMYKLFGLFVSSFLLLLLLTRGDGMVSALGAAWLCFSSFTQWWFSTNLPEMLTGLCLAVLGFLYVCTAERRVMRALGAVALLLGASSFAFQLYPPFQVPLAYAGAALAVGVLASRGPRLQFRAFAAQRIALLAACGAIIACVAWLFLVDAQDTISTVVATAYPGRRFSVGGTVAWWTVFDGIFEAWRVGEDTFPWANSNASESSDFILLFPLAVGAALFLERRLLRDPLVLALGAFCILLAAWMVVPLPDGISSVLSRLTLLSFVPATRAPVALGVASILLVAVCVARMRTLSTGRASGRHIAFTVLAAIAVYQYGAVLQGIDPGFFTGRRVLLGCLVAGLVAWALARGSRPALAAAAALAVIPGLMVNPVSRGLAPLLDKPALAAAVAADGGTGHRWLVVGNFVIPQAFKAVGLEVFGGTSYAPDIAALEVLDPGRQHVGVWNRYAHIQVESASGIAAPAFTLVQPDMYRLQLDICSRPLDTLGIDRVAYAGSAPGADLACLRPIGPQVDGISLYARTTNE